MAAAAKIVLPYNRQAVDAAKATGSKPVEFSVAGVAGLKLVCLPTGTATYVFAYTIGKGRHRKRSKLKLGRRDGLTLADARQKVEELRNKVAKGIDPADDAERAATAITFQELAEKRLAEDAKLGEATKRHYLQGLAADVFPEIGSKIAANVTPDHIARLLDKIEGRGKAVQADRTRAAIGSTFKWAIRRRLAGVKADPSAGLGKRSVQMPRTRVLSETEIAAFWHGIDQRDAPLEPRMRVVLKLALLTGQRRAEVAGARVSELHGLDGDAPRWVIPGHSKKAGKVVAGRSKNRQEQIVPLSHQAAQLFRHAVADAGDHSCVFPSEANRVKGGGEPRVPHMHPESVSRAMRRVRERYGIEDITTHDLRRTAATWLGDQGTRPDVIDIVLNHKPRDVTRLHYNL